MIFRFDDICINCDIDKHFDIVDLFLEKHPDATILWAISPFVDSSQKKLERVFPKIWNANSDHKVYYQMDKLGMPSIHPAVIRATHGLIHVDHRLMCKGAQEVSILTSASITGANIFIPPFNKYNQDTIDICKEHDIQLVKFEEGWRSMEYEDFDPKHPLWYLHAREWKVKTVREWFE